MVQLLRNCLIYFGFFLTIIRFNVSAECNRDFDPEFCYQTISTSEHIINNDGTFLFASKLNGTEIQIAGGSHFTPNGTKDLHVHGFYKVTLISVDFFTKSDEFLTEDNYASDNPIECVSVGGFGGYTPPIDPKVITSILGR